MRVAQLAGTHHYFVAVFTSRLYFFNTCCNCSCGIARTLKSFAPTIVSAPIMAFTTASSTHCTVAREQRIHVVVRHHLHFLDAALRSPHVGIGGRERKEDVARTVAGETAVPAQSQRNPARQPLQLARKDRRIGRHHHDDRAKVLPVRKSARQLAANIDPRNAQLALDAVIALHQHANRVPTLLRIQPS